LQGQFSFLSFLKKPPLFTSSRDGGRRGGKVGEVISPQNSAIRALILLGEDIVNHQLENRDSVHRRIRLAVQRVKCYCCKYACPIRRHRQ
jgi:hypothetical protein